MPYMLDDLELGILVRILNQPSVQTSPDPRLSVLLKNLEHAWHHSQMPFTSMSKEGTENIDADNAANLDTNNVANIDADQAAFLVAHHHGTYADVDKNPFQVCHPSSLLSTLYIF